MKRSLGIALVATATLLAGCASSGTTTLIHLPDGQPGYALNCSGSGPGSTWAECYELAGAACGATGYDIVSKDGDAGAPSGGGIADVVSANVKNRAMVVRCH